MKNTARKSTKQLAAWKQHAPRQKFIHQILVSICKEMESLIRKIEAIEERARQRWLTRTRTISGSR